MPAGGTVRSITRWGETVMHHKQEPITDFDDGLRELVADMVATMYAADGVGLAACQIGRDQSVFVFDCPDEDGVRHQGVVCNPVLFLPVGKDRKPRRRRRGLPVAARAFVPCARTSYARVEGQGVDGSPVSHAGTGLLARCLQHETDHCEGIVFGDRINKRSRKKLFKQADEAAPEFPAGWPA